jgi:hypothetical protein
MSRQNQRHIRCRFRHIIFDDLKHDRSSIKKLWIDQQPSILGHDAIRNESTFY